MCVGSHVFFAQAAPVYRKMKDGINESIDFLLQFSDQSARARAKRKPYFV